jgi:hypothetical protein
VVTDERGEVLETPRRLASAIPIIELHAGADTPHAPREIITDLT